MRIRSSVLKHFATNGLVVDLLLLSLKYGLYPELYPKPVTRFLLIIPNNPEFGNSSTYFFSPSTESVGLPGLIIGAAQRSFIRHNTNTYFINSNQGGVSATFRQGFLRRIPVVKHTSISAQTREALPDPKETRTQCKLLF